MEAAKKSAIKTACRYWRMKPEEYETIKHRRTRNAAKVRWVAWYLLYHVDRWTLEYIAKKFNKNDHTTVIHGLRKIDELELNLSIAQERYQEQRDLDRTAA